MLPQKQSHAYGFPTNVILVDLHNIYLSRLAKEEFCEPHNTKIFLFVRKGSQSPDDGTITVSGSETFWLGRKGAHLKHFS